MQPEHVTDVWGHPMQASACLRMPLPSTTSPLSLASAGKGATRNGNVKTMLWQCTGSQQVAVLIIIHSSRSDYHKAVAARLDVSKYVRGRCLLL
jgi:hypothetical protein